MDRPEKSNAKLWITIAVVVGVGFLCCLGSAILALIFILPGSMFEHDEREEAIECSRNLQNIYTGLIEYKVQRGHLPRESGVRFFVAPLAEGLVPYDREHAEDLTCPSVDLDLLTIGSLPWDEWWHDLSLVDGSYSSYAGRDTVRFPLDKLSGKQPLVGCDGDGYTHHKGHMNVLYGNGAVQTYSLDELIRDGVLPPGATSIPIGPGSPVEDLRKLTLD